MWHRGQHCGCIAAEVLPVAVHHSHVPAHRVHLQSDTSAGDFADLLLSIGDEAFPLTDHPDFITVPTTIEIQSQSLKELFQSVYPQIKINARGSMWLGERAIYARLNSMVNTINNRMVHD